MQGWTACGTKGELCPGCPAMYKPVAYRISRPLPAVLFVESRGPGKNCGLLARFSELPPLGDSDLLFSLSLPLSCCGSLSLRLYLLFRLR